MKRNISCLFLILGYNNHEMTDRCLATLRKNLGSIQEYQILLFDNGSKPTLRSIAKKNSVGYYRSDINLGFAAGYNKALTLSKVKNFDVVCLVNNDVIVDTKFAQALTPALQSFVECKSVAVMQPYLYLDKKHTKAENFGVEYFQSGLAFQCQSEPIPASILVNGACLFIKMSVVDELFSKYGYVFIPQYSMYAEDVELSIRLKRMGYDVRIEKALKAQHLASKSLGRGSYNALYFSWRNVLWTTLIHRKKSDLILSFPYVVAGQFILFGLSLRHGYPFVLLAIYGSTLQYSRFLWNTRRKVLGLPGKSVYSTKGIFRNRKASL